MRQNGVFSLTLCLDKQICSLPAVNAWKSDDISNAVAGSTCWECVWRRRDRERCVLCVVAGGPAIGPHIKGRPWAEGGTEEDIWA